MFKRIDGHWDHYTEKGFYEITEQIYTLIEIKICIIVDF